MMISRICVLATFSFFALVTSASASLQVDFNTSGSPTQAGFTSVGTAGASGIGGTGIGTSIDVSLASDGLIEDRLRSTTPGSLADLGVDFVFGNRAQNATYLDVIVAGIEAGLYSFEGFFHDSDPASGSENALVDVDYDNGSGFQSGLDDFPRSDGNDSVASGSFEFTANGTDPVTFRVTSDKNGHLINGFAINVVPEAGAFVVWGVLMGGTFVFGRGSRRSSAV